MEKKMVFNKEQKIDLNKHALECWRVYKKDPNAKFPEKIQVKPFDRKNIEKVSIVNINTLTAYKCVQRENMRSTKGYKEKIVENAIKNFDWFKFKPIIVCKFNNEYILVDGWGRYMVCKALGITFVPAEIHNCSTIDEVRKAYFFEHDNKIRTKITYIDDFWTVDNSNCEITKFIKDCFRQEGLIIDEKTSRNYNIKDTFGIVPNNEIDGVCFQNHIGKDIRDWAIGGNEWKKGWNENNKEKIKSLIHIATHLRKLNNGLSNSRIYSILVNCQTMLNETKKGAYINAGCTMENLFKNIDKIKNKNYNFSLTTRRIKYETQAKYIVETILKQKLYDPIWDSESTDKNRSCISKFLSVIKEKEKK